MISIVSVKFSYLHFWQLAFRLWFHIWIDPLIAFQNIPRSCYWNLKYFIKNHEKFFTYFNAEHFPNYIFQRSWNKWSCWRRLLKYVVECWCTLLKLISVLRYIHCWHMLLTYVDDIRSLHCHWIKDVVEWCCWHTLSNYFVDVRW